eukprot:1062043-Pyramimonas_sp.AAC.1
MWALSAGPSAERFIRPQNARAGARRAAALQRREENEDERGNNRCAQRAARAHGAMTQPRGVSHQAPPLGARARA